MSVIRFIPRDNARWTVIRDGIDIGSIVRGNFIPIGGYGLNLGELESMASFIESKSPEDDMERARR